MVSKTRRLFAAAVAAIAALALIPAGQAAAANIVNNPGFETGTTSSWSCTGATVVSSPVHGGTRALAGTPSGQDFAQCTQQIAVQPNTAYRLSAWVNGSYTYLGVNGPGLSDRNTWSPTAGAWTQLTIDFTTAASTTSVNVYIHGWYGQPTYYADDVSLDGPGGTPTVPGAPTNLSASATSATSVSLSWTGPSNATGFHVYRNGTRVASPTTTSYTDTGLTAQTTYSYAVSSFNTAGESPRSPAVSVTTPPTGGNPGGPLPKHVLTGYWQNFYNGARALRLADVPTTYDIIAIAFVDAVPGRPGGVSFTLDSGLSSQLGGYTDAQFRADVRTVKARGQKVIVSVGGERGTISVGDSTAANNFANDIRGLISSYGFDGVDIDLENGISPGPMATALRSIHAGGGTVITMAPQTIDMQNTSAGYFQLALNIKDILTIVNMQYYNSGSMNGCDGNVYHQGSIDFITALACIQLQGGLRPDQVGIGVPASSRAAGSGHVSSTLVNNALNCLTRGTNCGNFRPSTTWPALRGAMTWSTNWDALNGNDFSNNVGNHVHNLP